MPTIDTLTAPGAQRLVNAIKRYWLKRGVPPPALKVEAYRAAPDAAPLFVVRSNMLNGHPRTNANG